MLTVLASVIDVGKCNSVNFVRSRIAASEITVGMSVAHARRVVPLGYAQVAGGIGPVTPEEKKILSVSVVGVSPERLPPEKYP